MGIIWIYNCNMLIWSHFTNINIIWIQWIKHCYMNIVNEMTIYIIIYIMNKILCICIVQNSEFRNITNHQSLWTPYRGYSNYMHAHKTSTVDFSEIWHINRVAYNSNTKLQYTDLTYTFSVNWSGRHIIRVAYKSSTLKK